MRKKTWTFLFYLSETREVADLLLLPTETGAEPRWSRMTTCHLNTEAVRKLKKQKTSSHLILHMPTLATALFYTVVCRGGSIKKRDILALFVAFVISIQRLIFFFFNKRHTEQSNTLQSTVQFTFRWWLLYIYSQRHWLFVSSSVSWGQCERPPPLDTVTPPAWGKGNTHHSGTWLNVSPHAPVLTHSSTRRVEFISRGICLRSSVQS